MGLTMLVRIQLCTRRGAEPRLARLRQLDYGKRIAKVNSGCGSGKQRRTYVCYSHTIRECHVLDTSKRWEAFNILGTW